MVLLRVAALYVAAFYVTSAEAYATSIPFLPGCGKRVPEGQTIGTVANAAILSGGLQRNYLISIPTSYNAIFPTPIILSYHGGVRTAEDQLQLDQLTNPEFNKFAFVVYPQGINV